MKRTQFSDMVFKDKLSKILSIVGGVLLVIGGMFCMFNPSNAYITLAMFIGIVLVIIGLINIYNYFSTRKTNPGASWLLADGLITLILGGISIYYKLANLGGAYGGLGVSVTDAMMLGIFAMWLVFGGVTRIVSSCTVKPSYWGAILALGFGMVCLGVFCMAQPVIATFTLMIGVGIVLVGYGVGMALGLLGASRDGKNKTADAAEKPRRSLFGRSRREETADKAQAKNEGESDK